MARGECLKGDPQVGSCSRSQVTSLVNFDRVHDHAVDFGPLECWVLKEPKGPKGKGSRSGRFSLTSPHEGPRVGTWHSIPAI